jgi:hypothetical protein
MLWIQQNISFHGLLRFLCQFQQVDVNSGSGLQEPDPEPPIFTLQPGHPHNTDQNLPKKMKSILTLIKGRVSLIAHKY